MSWYVARNEALRVGRRSVKGAGLAAADKSRCSFSFLSRQSPTGPADPSPSRRRLRGGAEGGERITPASRSCGSLSLCPHGAHPERGVSAPLFSPGPRDQPRRVPCGPLLFQASEAHASPILLLPRELSPGVVVSQINFLNKPLPLKYWYNLHWLSF